MDALVPLVLSVVAAALVVAIREGRRRAALNAALHELRRPLQVLALQSSSGDGDLGQAGSSDAYGDVAVAGRDPDPNDDSSPAAADPDRGPVEMAAAALARLEREINGEAVVIDRAPVLARPLAESALRRWRGRAARAGATLELRWNAGGAAIDADRGEIAAALDNLIDNAIEHGGPRIAVEAGRFADMLALAVVDSGVAPRSAPVRRRRTSFPLLFQSGPPLRVPDRTPSAGAAADPLARLSGRRRHGHGLRVVRRTAAAHGGRFDLHRGESGTTAVLALPLLDRERRR
jgi:signal transduction histidine kinase